MTTTLRGTLERIAYQGRNFFSIAALRTTDGKATIKGPLVGVAVGDSLELAGAWVDDPRWGPQFVFRTSTTIAPADACGVVAWLESRLPGIGRSRAMTLVERFGQQGVFAVLADHPERIAEVVPGITVEKAREIGAAYRASVGDRDTMVWLKRWQLTDVQCGKVLAHFGGGEKAKAALEANPYALLALDGFGFPTVDGIAIRMGVPVDSLERARCGVVHVLTEARQEGHTFLPERELVQRAAKVAAPGIARDRVEAVLQGERDGVVVEGGDAEHTGLRCCYLCALLRCEVDVAEHVGRLAA